MKRLLKLSALLISLLLVLCISLTSCLDGFLPGTGGDGGTADSGDAGGNGGDGTGDGTSDGQGGESDSPISLDEIPEYSGDIYIAINGNIPYFTEDEITSESYEFYDELDSLGRCTVTIACIGTDIMPTEERESLSYNPTGWHSIKYDHVSGKYLYNRCHLIGHQLTGENDNPKNLITGTRSLNVDGMLLFEDMVADYVKENENHVMYRVTPIFKGNELVARGVLMEGWSVEDNGEGICFCVYVYNNQDGVIIDYATGESRLDDGSTDNETTPDDLEEPTDTPTEDSGASTDSVYIINTSTKKYHTEDCRYSTSQNTEEYIGTAEELEADGYVACQVCNP
ncbi:MAG: DNA/RNA non-specific endonuclease [Clostridia bacterium]|nr:DNA/RNA non-specific endonuclease [Clostridia bacterium]